MTKKYGILCPRCGDTEMDTKAGFTKYPYCSNCGRRFSKELIDKIIDWIDIILAGTIDYCLLKPLMWIEGKLK